MLSPRGYWAVILSFALLSLLLRTWQLEISPPFLWWDEASQGVDAREILQGRLRIFYPRALGKEPLYIYLTTPFAAVLDGQPVATRLAGAFSGALTTVAIGACAMALWRDRPALARWAGLIAAALWTVNFWPLSLNRIGFQVNTFPLMLTLAVTAWLNWVYRPNRGRALFFGVMAGLVLYTYLAARITPLLWVALYLSLAANQRRLINRWLPYAAGAFGATIAPLALYFLRHPAQLTARIATVGGESVTLGDRFREIGRIGALFMGLDGDPLLRHNLPHQSPFPWWLAIIFLIGLLPAAWALLRPTGGTRAHWAWTLLLWLGILCLPAWLAAEDNPHFTRLFGVLPSALLLAAYAPALLLTRATTGKVTQRPLGIVLVAGILFAGSSASIPAYFDTWRNSPDLYIWYQGDYWDLGEYAEAHGDATLLVPVLTEPYVFDYAFSHAPVVALEPDDPALERTLAATVTGPYLDVARWDTGVEAQADPRHVMRFYAEREGAEIDETSLRRNTVVRYALADEVDFAADGIMVDLDQPFGRGVRLTGARYGAAAPNPDRSSSQLQPGGTLWLILEWTAASPSQTVRVATKALDSTGHQLAPSDEWLFPGEVTGWTPETAVRTYHLLTVPPTTPPGEIALTVELYDDETLLPLMPIESESPRVQIGTATVQPGPEEQFVLEDTVEINRTVADGITWRGHDPLPAVHPAGLTLNTMLYFVYDRVPTRPVELTVSVTEENSAADEQTAPVTLLLPPDATPGRPFHLSVPVPIGPELDSGRYVLQVGEDAGEESAISESFAVEGRAHLFDRPHVGYSSPLRAEGVAALVGVAADGPIPAHPGGKVAVPLVWQAAGNQPTEWMRFVHVVDDTGALVAQTDGLPCQGRCRPRTWLAGEYLEDTVTLTLPPELVPGEYRVVAGWYDPATLARVPVWSPSGPAEAGGAMPVPVVIRVEGN